MSSVSYCRKLSCCTWQTLSASLPTPQPLPQTAPSASLCRLLLAGSRFPGSQQFRLRSRVSNTDQPFTLFLQLMFTFLSLIQRHLASFPRLSMTCPSSLPPVRSGMKCTLFAERSGRAVVHLYISSLARCMLAPCVKDVNDVVWLYFRCQSLLSIFLTMMQSFWSGSYPILPGLEITPPAWVP